MTPAPVGVPDAAAALAEQLGELAAVLDGLDEAGWAAPSRCAGWSVSDVVLHLAQTNEMAVGSLDGSYSEVVARLAGGLPPVTDVDAGVDAMVAKERGGSPQEVRARWDRSVAAMAAGFEAVDPDEKVTWVAGQLRAGTLAVTRLTETWIHTGDVAAGVGVQLQPADRLWHVARLAWRTLPYAFQRDGRPPPEPVAFHLRAPSGGTWDFVPDDVQPATVVRGDGAELCAVASRRVDPADTALIAYGAEPDAVLSLIRTWA
jgi:uncharacterized protein (TIGR03084 family)